MTNAPKSRKTHVIRILGTNKKGDVLPDIWADVERMDEAKTVYQSDVTSFQGTVRRLKWLDDPDKEDYNKDGPRSRKIDVLKVCSPDEPDQSNPEEWIPIQRIAKLRTTEGDQGKVSSFVSAGRNDARVVKQRRIPHYDTSIDDDAQKAFDADPTRKVFVVKGDRYEKKTETKDDTQYLEHEVIMALKGRVNEETRTGKGADQGKQTKLLNQYQVDESDPAKLEKTGPEGFNPPWRLDPYQNIVNVQFNKFLPKYAVAFGDAGSLGELILFDVNEQGQLIKRFVKANVFSASGYFDSKTSSPSDPSIPSDLLPLPVVNISAFDWKGNLRAVAGTMFNAATDGTLSLTHAPVLMDKDGKSLSALPAPPKKGVQKGGFWVTNSSIAFYTGDRLDWKIDAVVYEILPGRKILGQLAPDFIYGVYTVATDGSIRDFLQIANGGANSDASFFYIWDTSSNGDTYFQAEARSDGGTRLKRIDKNNVVKWEIASGLATNTYNGGPNRRRRDLVVVENRKGVFVLNEDQGPGYGGFRFPASGATDPLNDSFLQVFNSSGVVLSRQKWGTYQNRYVAGENEFGDVVKFSNEHMLRGVLSSSRYPDPA